MMQVEKTHPFYAIIMGKRWQDSDAVIKEEKFPDTSAREKETPSVSTGTKGKAE